MSDPFPPVSPPSVFLVEDSESLASALKAILARRGQIVHRIDPSGFTDLRQAALDIGRANPDAVYVDLNLQTKEAGSGSQRIGLELALWLKAIPGHSFPVIGYSVEGQSNLEVDRRFQILFSHGKGLNAGFWDISNSDYPPKIMVDPVSNRNQAWELLDLKIRETEIAFRHGFARNLLSSLRLLLGAMRTGAVSLYDGKQVLEQLREKSIRAGKEPECDIDMELIRWYIESTPMPVVCAEVNEPGLRRRGILIDDEVYTAGWADVFRVIFGDEFRACTTWVEATSLLAVGPFDFALVDLELAGEGKAEQGIQILARLRSEAFDLPIVAFTGSDDAPKTIAALQSGADYYFVKELGDASDRDSGDYFNRFRAVIKALPRATNPARRSWRRFNQSAATLQVWEDQFEMDEYSHLGSAEFFRLAYYFWTADRRVIGQRTHDPRLTLLCQDIGTQRVRHTVFPAGAALFEAAEILIDRASSKVLPGKLHNKRASLAEKILTLSRKLKWPGAKCKQFGKLNKLPKHGTTRVVSVTDQERSFPGKVNTYLSLLDSLMQENILGFAPQGRYVGQVTAKIPVKEDASRARNSHRERNRAALDSLGQAWQDREQKPIYLKAYCNFLLVDDDPKGWFWFCKGLFPGNSFYWIQPQSTSGLLDAIASRKPDVVLLDLHWWKDDYTSALELIEQIRRRWFALPVLVISGIRESVAVQRALRRGVSGYFPRCPVESAYISSYLDLFTEEVCRVSMLAKQYRGMEIWRRIDAICAAPKPSGVDAMTIEASLRMAFFTFFPDRNPQEPWRGQYLLGLPTSTSGLNSELMTCFSMFYAHWPLEHIVEACKPSDQVIRMYQDIVTTRNDVLYRRHKISPSVRMAVMHFQQILGLIEDILRIQRVEKTRS